MVFSSLLFLLLFLPVTIILYYIVPKRLKNLFLLIASLIFYAWGEPRYIILMLFTTIYIWALTLLLEKFKKKGKDNWAKVVMIFCVVFSLGVLAYYKYFGFLVDNLPFLRNTSLSKSSPSLPIGISFYTFQALSYVIDVYRGDVKAQKNWIHFAMYISLFPQLIAGPIVRYTDIESQLEQRTFCFDNMYQGIIRFIIGLGKKVLLANQIGVLWDTISTMTTMSTVSAWLGAIAFFFQIYFDFSAYSDMAIGLGNMLGFHFTENFHYPYESKSITEFWRRWHITLGTWFREYVYIPLGGNRKGKARLVLNLFVVWSLTGLWHGADWQFLLWGVYYFVFLVIEKFFLLPKMKKWPDVIKHVYTILIVILGWVMFACDDIQTAGLFYKAMFGIGVPVVDSTAIYYLMSNIVLLVILCIGATELPKRIVMAITNRMDASHKEWLTNCVAYLILLLAIAFLVADSYNPFLYFRF